MFNKLNTKLFGEYAKIELNATEILGAMLAPVVVRQMADPYPETSNLAYAAGGLMLLNLFKMARMLAPSQVELDERAERARANVRPGGDIQRAE